MMPSQNLAPSLCCIQMPSTSLVLSRWMSQGQVHRAARALAFPSWGLSENHLSRTPGKR